MASEMVERVARRLCKDCGVDPERVDGGSWDGGALPMGIPAWECWEGEARAAIEAMREPTQEMHEAAADFHRFRLSTPAEYRHMIDAALKD